MNNYDSTKPIETQKIEFIKMIRDVINRETGFTPGLKECKDFCDTLVERRRKDNGLRTADFIDFLLKINFINDRQKAYNALYATGLINPIYGMTSESLMTEKDRQHIPF